MAQVSFNQVNEMSNYSNDNGFGFFTLKNNGDEAIVRIMHDTVESFDIVAVHNIEVNGKYRKISCLRNDAREPMENCPLCANGSKLENRFFIHLIQYDKLQDGTIVPSAKIWERSFSYAKRLASMLQEYGPLSDCVFKIKRNGEAKSMDTTYDIMFANPQVYRPELYPKREDLFENYKTIGTIVMDKNYDEITQFMVSGQFPMKAKEVEQVTAGAYQSYAPQQNVPNTTGNPYPPTDNPYPLTGNPYPQQTVVTNQVPAQQYAEMRSVDQMPVQSTTVPVYSPSSQSTPAAPWESNQPVINRPVRKY